MPLPNWLIPTLGLLGACVGAIIISIGNYVVQRWRYRVDRGGIAIDHLCNEINAAADLAGRYWLMDSSVAGSQAEISGLEAELVGRQLRLQAIVLALDIQDPKLDLTGVDTQLALLYERMTGGDFQVADRPTSVTMARLVHQQAAQMNGLLRVALARRVRRHS